MSNPDLLAVAEKQREAESERGLKVPLMASKHDSAPLGTVIASQSQANFIGSAETPVKCWICEKAGDQNDLFKPCMCDTFSHRSTCFRKWRQGWINPRNYFSCPNCMYQYKIERVRESSTQSKEEIRRRYRFEVIKMWLFTFLFFGVLIGGIATISYFCDPNKNVPVGIKYMLSSVVNGFPNSNSTQEWRENFHKKSVHVWQYYTLLATFITSVFVLIGFCLIGCTFDESERRANHGMCEDCCDNATWYSCYMPCDCNCDCKCNDCKMDNCGDCGDMGELAIVLVIIVVVVVIFSAVFVIILYACQKWSLLYDRMTHMLLAQQEELEGETMILAINETWRPTTAV